MTTIPSNLRRVLRREPRVRPSTEPVAAPPERVEAPPVEIAPNDPLVAYFSGATGAVDIGALQLDSPALEGLREAGIKLVVPLVSQGELIGLLNLGPRRSEQEYSADDRKLLNDLAGHAAPAVRVAQLVREQEAEVRQRERIEQELRVAQLIQQQFLPEELPNLPGWQFAAFYGPAREVGGDFYDFIKLPEGQVGIVVGDVTDKGVPAALVMATTHSILRAEAPRLVAPSEVLTRVNNLLVDEMPAHMFVTCLYAVLDPETGRLRYANAGHNVPYVSTEGGVTELRATGMPLGLLPEMEYEEKEATLAPGDTVLLHSDGLAEAHNTDREMFGFPRVANLTGEASDGEVLIDRLLKELQEFVGPDLEQEDDITLVTLGRRAAGGGGAAAPEALPAGGEERQLAAFEVASEPGNERQAIDQVAEAVAGLGLDGPRLERLKTAVGEATMNAIEHGNGNRPELPVTVSVVTDGTDVKVRITDQGGERPLPDVETPDLEAKLAGLQTPRGWGLFLIQNMVDALNTAVDEHHHTIELVMHLKEAPDARS
ncbi:MAG TPA: SpoIIE family protein phosphatase [Actinomycetes bacterium]|jgi:serine phosphatase RsbU (regulator of sigma subunit)/anti-sigma regulatory factor (Ser/Thr protein kinase)|nr:SpoIIE family protein phosphatase [Actinomycetes bacterium]